MEFILKDSSGVDFKFPVNPEEVNITRGKDVETVNILSLGEYDFPGGEKVKEIAFSSFFPLHYNKSYCTYEDFPDPKTAMDQLTAMMSKGEPLRLLIVGENTKLLNALVILSAHNNSFRGGEPGDIYFDIVARTWRKPKVHTKAGTVSSSSQTGAGAKAKTSRSDTRKKSVTYVVKSGDSLAKIAKRELGSSSKWQAIYKLNKATIGADPNKIKVGQKLVMPT